MPTFCRHNRLVQNCTICAREQDVELRPVVSPQGRPAATSRPAGASSTRTSSPARGRPRANGGRGAVTVRRLERDSGDDFHSDLVPGLKSGPGAERLAAELAFATTRLDRLAGDPPGLYAEVAADAGTLEERTWLAFEIAYLGPCDGDAPFAGIEQSRVSWSGGQAPSLAEVPLGPRTSHEASRGGRTCEGYRAWAGRAGSQAAAFSGEAVWTPERRFDRVFERLGSLPGLSRAARFDLLVTLGATGVYELQAGSLHVGGTDPVTLAAKRILGIGDPLLLQRRAAELAEACGVALAAVDLAFFNWEQGRRSGAGLEPDAEPDPGALQSARAALGV